MNHIHVKRAALAIAVAGVLAAATLISSAEAAEAAIDARLRVSVPGAEIAFRTTPRWVVVPGTDVYIVRHDMRPAQDFFRYRKWYYVHHRGAWYRSKSWNGRYVYVRERDLPRAFRDVPRHHWRTYPRGWRHDRDHWRSARDDRWEDRRDRREDRWDRREDREDRWEDRQDRRDGPRGTW